MKFAFLVAAVSGSSVSDLIQLFGGNTTTTSTTTTTPKVVGNVESIITKFDEMDEEVPVITSEVDVVGGPVEETIIFFESLINGTTVRPSIGTACFGWDCSTVPSEYNTTSTTTTTSTTSTTTSTTTTTTTTTSSTTTSTTTTTASSTTQALFGDEAIPQEFGDVEIIPIVIGDAEGGQRIVMIERSTSTTTSMPQMMFRGRALNRQQWTQKVTVTTSGNGVVNVCTKWGCQYYMTDDEYERMLYRPSPGISTKIVRAKMSVENGAVWVETDDGLDIAPFELTCDADYVVPVMNLFAAFVVGLVGASTTREPNNLGLEYAEAYRRCYDEVARTAQTISHPSRRRPMVPAAFEAVKDCAEKYLK